VSVEVLDSLQVHLDKLSIADDSQLHVENVSLSEYMNSILNILSKVLQLPKNNEIIYRAREILDDFSELKVDGQMEAA
jgi:hypothetical protein